MNDVIKLSEIDKTVNMVQLRNPRSKRYIKVSRKDGRIVSHKQSDGPYKNIPIVFK